MSCFFSIRSGVAALVLMSVIPWRQASADTPNRTITKSTQTILVAEAQAQRASALKAETRLQRGEDLYSIRADLTTAFDRWQSLKANDLEKAALSACANWVNNLNALTTSKIMDQNWQRLDAQKKRHIDEDRSECVAALKSPRKAFVALADSYGLVVE